MASIASASGHQSTSLKAFIDTLFEDRPDAERVARFVPGPGLRRLAFRLDIDKLRQAVSQVVGIASRAGKGLDAMSLTRKPADPASTSGQNNLSGLYWIRSHDSYEESRREGPVEEIGFSGLVTTHTWSRPLRLLVSS